MNAPKEQVIKMYAAREEIYPREIAGRYARLRWLFVWLTQLAFYCTPWLQWNGRQALLFDLAARKFYIFGLVLWPQDFIYLALLLIICAYLLFLATGAACCRAVMPAATAMKSRTAASCCRQASPPKSTTT